MIKKWYGGLVVAFFGILVWAFVGGSRAVDAGYTEADSDYFYDPAAAPAPDMFQTPAASTRSADENGFRRATAELERDDSTVDLVEVHIEYFEYVVEEGDSLWGIERRFGIRFELIYELNRMTIDRNYARRCGEPSGLLPKSGHCSAPEATLQKGMILLIPTDIWIAPIRSYEM